MNTDELVQFLATHFEPAQSRRMWPRIALTGGGGGLLALGLMLVFQGLRPDVASAVFTGPFWMKLAFPALLVLGCSVALNSIARPGAPLSGLWRWLVAPVLAVWAVAGVELYGAMPGDRSALVMGVSWAACVGSVALLSLPVLVALFWVMRQLAPTRLAVAGACAGLLAGAVGALAYALHCPETSASFLGLWYVLGMAMPLAVGALLGPRLLRW